MFGIFKKRNRMTPAEIAAVLKEALEMLGEQKQERTDWMLITLEKHEMDESTGQFLQSIRAELFRLGVKHSNQQ